MRSQQAPVSYNVFSLICSPLCFVGFEKNETKGSADKATMCYDLLSIGRSLFVTYFVILMIQSVTEGGAVSLDEPQTKLSFSTSTPLCLYKDLIGLHLSWNL